MINKKLSSNPSTSTRFVLECFPDLYSSHSYFATITTVNRTPDHSRHLSVSVVNDPVHCLEDLREHYHLIVVLYEAFSFCICTLQFVITLIVIDQLYVFDLCSRFVRLIFVT